MIKAKTTKKYLPVLISFTLLLGIFSSILFSFPHETKAVTTLNKTLSLPGNFTGLVGYWTMDGKDTVWTSGTAATTLDKSGNGNTGTLANMAQATSISAGKFGQALLFDGSDDYVDISDVSASLAASSSISVWINPRSLGINQRIFGGRTNSAPVVGLYPAPYGIIASGSAQGNQRTGSTSTLLLNQWNHIVVTYDASSVPTIYVNGLEVSYNSPVYWGTTNSSIGKSGGSTFNGSIDEVRLYNRIISATEISALYNAGIASHFNVTPKNVLTSGLVGHWTMDGKDTVWTSSTAATTLDKSGNGNTGTLTNMAQATSPVAGKIGQGLKFDGGDDSVAVSGDIVGTGADSICSWIRPTGWGGGDFGRLFDNGGTLIWLYGAGQALRFTSAGASPYIETAGSSIKLNQWQHICAVRDASGSGIVYINAVAFAGTTGTPIAGSTSYIGNRSAADRAWNGNIDDFRIYNRALSADEVKQLYNMGR